MSKTMKRKPKVTKQIEVRRQRQAYASRMWLINDLFDQLHNRKKRRA